MSAQEAPSAAQLLRKLYLLCRLAFRVVVLIYLLALLLLMIGMHVWGQTNLTTAALMFLPQWVWIAPAFMLILPALVLDWKSALLLPSIIIWYILGHLGYQLRDDPPPDVLKPLDTIRVLTWNRGQGKGASLQPLKNELRPDFILLQDAGTAAYYKGNKDYAEFREVSGAGEFVLLSRWPVLSAELLAFAKRRNHPGATQPTAARFVVAAAGKRCVIYSVHLPSPRDSLNSYRGGAFLWGIIGLPGTPWEAKKQFYQQFWDEQIRLAREISDRASHEHAPVIIVGDFNSPSFGPVHRMFTSFLQDTHQHAGSGFGNSFPGVTNNPLALFQPWLRLDQIFASADWHITRSSPRQVPAQHLPVFAEMRLLPSTPASGIPIPDNLPDIPDLPTPAAPP